jgi:branched-chain amino acid aminotransferase
MEEKKESEKMMEEPFVYIDGTFYPKSRAKISVFDHGLLYGDGIFEGIRVYNGLIFKLREHIDRLYHSAHTILLSIPFGKEKMIEKVIRTVRINGLKDAYIRLIVTRGVGDLGLDPRKCPKPTIIIIVEPTITLHGKEAKENGIRAIISWVKRDSVDGTTHEVKSLNYLNSILAKIEANNVGADEAIYLDQNGHIVEGVAENIFIVRENTIITPFTCSGALPGITQKEIMKMAASLGYKVEERNITPHELFNADEVFFTGTAAEIVPVIEINGRTIGGGKPGPITKLLIEEFKKLIQDPNQGISIF